MIANIYCAVDQLNSLSLIDLIYPHNTTKWVLLVVLKSW